jgi:chromosome segregation ATPase
MGFFGITTMNDRRKKIRRLVDKVGEDITDFNADLALRKREIDRIKSQDNLNNFIDICTTRRASIDKTLRSGDIRELEEELAEFESKKKGKEEPVRDGKGEVVDTQGINKLKVQLDDIARQYIFAAGEAYNHYIKSCLSGRVVSADRIIESLTRSVATIGTMQNHSAQLAEKTNLLKELKFREDDLSEILGEVAGNGWIKGQVMYKLWINERNKTSDRMSSTPADSLVSLIATVNAKITRARSSLQRII